MLPLYGFGIVCIDRAKRLRGSADTIHRIGAAIAKARALREIGRLIEANVSLDAGTLRAIDEARLLRMD